jgi:hypothetical protein
VARAILLSCMAGLHHRCFRTTLQPWLVCTTAVPAPPSTLGWSAPPHRNFASQDSS